MPWIPARCLIGAGLRDTMKWTLHHLSLLILLSPGLAVAQTAFNPEARDNRGIRAVFYNVENLFDPYRDASRPDTEYTSGGTKAWNYHRYRVKLLNLSKVIAAVGGMELPELVGLAEVENWQTVFDLSRSGPLASALYSILHEDSPDPRGIEVALMYRGEKLRLLHHYAIRVDQASVGYPFRDILYACFEVLGADSLHVWVNHWPSRFGPESRRFIAARALRCSIDSLLHREPEARILIMGDFNDEPDDESLLHVLDARRPGTEGAGLINLSYAWHKRQVGTLYRRDVLKYWQIFDQVIVSANLLTGMGLQVSGGIANIYDAPWLIEPGGGPKRSHQGPVYKGGFSDHLPVYLDLLYQ